MVRFTLKEFISCGSFSFGMGVGGGGSTGTLDKILDFVSRVLASLGEGITVFQDTLNCKPKLNFLLTFISNSAG